MRLLIGDAENALALNPELAAQNRAGIVRMAETLMTVTILSFMVAMCYYVTTLVHVPVDIQPIPAHTLIVQPAVVLSPLDSTLGAMKVTGLELSQLQQKYDALKSRYLKQLAVEVGQKENLAWPILYGLWMQESKHNPLALGDGKTDSATGLTTWYAFGIGQVHLSTGRKQYRANITKEELLDPKLGGFVSGKILADYIRLFRGDQIRGLAAYQMGPGRLKAEIRSGALLPSNMKYVAQVLLFAANAPM